MSESLHIAPPPAKRQKTTPRKTNVPEEVGDDEKAPIADGDDDPAAAVGEEDDEDEGDQDKEPDEPEKTAKTSGPASSAKRSKESVVPKEDDLAEVEDDEE